MNNMNLTEQEFNLLIMYINAGYKAISHELGLDSLKNSIALDQILNKLQEQVKGNN